MKIKICLILFLAFCGPISAQELSLDIDEVSRLALANSLDIQIAKFDTYIARSTYDKSQSIFDTFLSAGVNYQKDKSDQVLATYGTVTKKNTYSFGVDKKLPSGTTLSISGQDARTASDVSLAALNPRHEAQANLSLTQSLGKNFFGIADRGDIKITKIDIENTEFSSLEDIESSLYEVQLAYWKFVLKCEELTINQDIVGQAQRLFCVYKENYRVGLAELSDLLAVHANLKVREGDLLIAGLEKETAKNNLLFLVNADDLTVELKARDKLKVTPYAVDLNQSLTEAVNNRRDYKKTKKSLEKNGITVAVKENALWPQIDLELSFTRNGITRQYKPAWHKISSENRSDFSVGVTVTFPLENREAKSELRATRLKKEQLLLSLKRVERLILRQIHDKTASVNTVQNQVTLSEKIADLQTKKLAEETRRIEQGRSNADTLIRYEYDLRAARLALAQSLFQYRLSLIDLELTKNTLLDKYWGEAL